MRSVDRSSPLVLGLDIGGTSSRAAVCDLHGSTLGTGSAGGGNPNSHPPDRAADQVRAAAVDALADTGPEHVRACMLGMAGVSKMTDPEVAALFGKMWVSLGLTCDVDIVSDCEVAFAAGTAAPSGTVVIAGTGAVAARIDEHRLASIAGGYGWLLGDEGSAFWLGREAVRTALHRLDRGEREHGQLVTSIFATLLPDSHEPPAVRRKQLITAVNSTPPVQLAELAPLVTLACDAGDPVAADIVQRAAVLLAETVRDARHPAETTPIVLGGSLVVEGNPLGEALRRELTSRYHGDLRTSGAGAAGAAWLAARTLLANSDLSADELHAKYLG